jgi:hypothetical protein
LHFSKHDTLVNILWNEFADVVPEDDAKSWAIRLFPECEPVFAEYPLTDDFAYEPAYELLYTELTGIIAIYFEEHGIQTIRKRICRRISKRFALPLNWIKKTQNDGSGACHFAAIQRFWRVEMYS